MSYDRTLALIWVLFCAVFFAYYFEFDPDAHVAAAVLATGAIASTGGLLKGGIWARTVIRTISVSYLIISFLLLLLWSYLSGYTGGPDYIEDPAILIFGALFVAGIGLAVYTLFALLKFRANTE